MSMLDKVKVWRHEDGGISITYFNKDAMKKDETEDSFIERSVSELMSKFEKYKKMQSFDSTRKEINQLRKSSPRAAIGRIKCSNTGVLTIDESVKLEAEDHREIMTAAKEKLKAIGLSDDEAAFAVERKFKKK